MPIDRKQTALPTAKPTPLTETDPLALIVGAIADAVAARLGDRNELVAIAPGPLATFGLEHAAVSRLVAEGRLRAVRIGRRLFTTHSRLLALVDELPEAVRTQPAPAEDRDDLHEAVRAMARRSVRKHKSGPGQAA